MKTSVTGLLKGRITRRRLLAAVLPAAGVSLAWAGEKSDEHGRDDQHHRSFKLEGAWVARVPSIPPLLWTYIMSPDPSGLRATLSGSIVVKVPARQWFAPLFDDQEYASPMVGEMVMTGHNTAKFTSIWYGLKRVDPPNPFEEQVVNIGVSSGESRFIGPGKAEVTHHMAFYYPAADADGDGLPDPGQAPFFCLPTTISLDTRVGLMPPCTP
jgi:hypothetical protein